MANTYVLIASNTLSTTTASVTFSSIPGTYTDLVVRVSARSVRSAASFDDLRLRLNNLTAGNPYPTTVLQGSGSAASSTRYAYNAMFAENTVPAANATSNTFGTAEYYIPNYNSSTTKQVSQLSISETNASTAYINASAVLFNDTTAITRIDLLLNWSSFASGSSFFLYGIKNS